MRYGFVGLGNLGRHLAASLRRGGFEIVVHDLDPGAAARLIAQGALWASSPKATAEAADSVITCLPSPAAVAAVVAGEDGMLDGLRPGGTWIDMSTNDPDEDQASGGARRGQGDRLPRGAGDRRRAQGGRGRDHRPGRRRRATYEAHLRAFEAMGGAVLHIGPLGSAAVIKVITNMLAFVHLVALGEALMLARRGGLDLALAFAAIKASSGNSFVHETESQVILNGSYDIGFTMDLACKDLGFASRLGRDLGVPLALAGVAEQTFQRARKRYGGNAWSPMVVKLLEDALGTDLRAPGFPASLDP